jgi:hypothetical protein
VCVSGCGGGVGWLCPVPWQEFGEAIGWLGCDPAQDIGEPSPRINIVEPGSDDEAVDRRGTLATAIRSGEQPSFPPQGDATEWYPSGGGRLPPVSDLSDGFVVDVIGVVGSVHKCGDGHKSAG